MDRDIGYLIGGIISMIYGILFYFYKDKILQKEFKNKKPIKNVIFSYEERYKQLKYSVYGFFFLGLLAIILYLF